jgi:hypothetical protein
MISPLSHNLTITLKIYYALQEAHENFSQFYDDNIDQVGTQKFEQSCKFFESIIEKIESALHFSYNVLDKSELKYLENAYIEGVDKATCISPHSTI